MNIKGLHIKYSSQTYITLQGIGALFQTVSSYQMFIRILANGYQAKKSTNKKRNFRIPATGNLPLP